MTARERALRHVAAMVARYRAGLAWRLPATTRVFYEAREKALSRELALLRTTGPEAERAARFWVGIGGAE